MMLGFIRFWRSMGDRPASFLALLIRAREMKEHEASVSAAFRAGLKVGSAHPEIAGWLAATYEEET
ncbi:hypothetical protein PBI_DAOB_66 [Arthrobacter phage Daob]|uniref:Uncharacterized protein n=4 Tax=Coralvirus coral TaxID=2734227 RepID=A0A5J6TQR1_9CAUD|nr:hypothetical protein PBI_COTE_68 [Arthrobacter phage Cote]AYN57713.1 hypothetical protein PBI_DAOB_66 [Arthrobacter phage Daob]AYN58819.1 hypothetical protein PBI_POLKA_64 [Arthrobacter phage Polka]QFG13115.1 hypothetical protein PBI_AMELIA_64 [Arthrobacter phage Amelia]